MRIAKSLLLVLLMGAAFSLRAAEALPVEAFTAFEQYDNLLISPGGTRLALTHRVDGKHVLAIVDYPSMKSGRSAHFGVDIDIEDVKWVNEDRLLIQPARRLPGYMVYKAPTGEIIRVDAVTAKAELIFGFLAGKQQTGTRVAQRGSVDAAGRLLSVRQADPAVVLMQTVGYGVEGDFNDAYRMNIDSGLLTKVAGSPVRNGRFVTGPDQRVSLVHGFDVDNQLRVWHRDSDRGDWVQKIGPERPGILRPLAWTGEGDDYYALDDKDAPTTGVAVWNAATGAERLLYRNANADLYQVVTDQAGKPVVFETTDHFPVYWYPEPAHVLAKLHQGMVARFPQQYVRIISYTDDLKLATLKISAARRPPTFLLVEVATGKLLQGMPAFPDLKPEQLAPVEPIEYRARDGMKIRGYLTTPVATDGKPAKKLPLVTIVHGGPHGAADDYDWEFERQLFASRGYAVLQVNFRGSWGRGRLFERAGYGRWGKEMQDDVTDGIRWAIQDGVADASRLCIYGGSYGAYSALTGVFREPELFKCAVGMAGVYDLPLMFRKGDIQTSDRGENYLREALGEDSEELRARSPVNNAAAIKAKVLLLHGKDDERAPFAHAERMRKALVQAGNPPEWIVEGGEAHGFFNEKNRAEAYQRILAFVDKNIGH